MAFKRKFLTLADADDLWVDQGKYVWFYNAVDNAWANLSPPETGGFEVNDFMSPSEDLGPFTQLLQVYRNNGVEE